MKYGKYIVFALVGFILFAILNTFLEPQWKNDASVDIFFSIIIDFFIIQIIIMAYEDRSEKRFKQHLQKHLRDIEKKMKY